MLFLLGWKCQFSIHFWHSLSLAGWLSGCWHSQWSDWFSWHSLTSDWWLTQWLKTTPILSCLATLCQVFRNVTENHGAKQPYRLILTEQQLVFFGKMSGLISSLPVTENHGARLACTSQCTSDWAAGCLWQDVWSDTKPPLCHRRLLEASFPVEYHWLYAPSWFTLNQLSF